MKSILSLLLLVTFTASAVTLTGTKNIPGNYATLALAITDLNLNGVGAGGVIFNVIASNPQTAPAGGYVIGGATAHATVINGVAANAISFVGNANTITASYPQTTNSNVDGIIKIVGADYVRITGFTIRENPTASAANQMTEWGISLFYVSATNGAQNNSIQNCVISLNKTNPNTFGIYSNTRHTNTSLNSADISNATGANSNNKFYGNTISNCNAGITLIGSSNAAYQDTNNDIGGSVAGTGNSISGWGEASTTTIFVSNSADRYGIYINQQTNENVSYNSVVSSNISGSASPNIIGIYKNYSDGQPTGTITSNITNNTITITDNLTTTAVNGIYAIATLGVTSLATATFNIKYNTITNCTIAATSTNSNLQLIFNSSVIGTINVNYNTVTGSVTGVTGGTYSVFHNTAAIINAINVTNNQFGNSTTGVCSFTNANTSVTSWVVYLVSIQAGASTCVLNINNNTFSGLSMVSTLTVLSLPADSEVSKVGAVYLTTNFLGSAVNINNNKFGTATEDFVKFSAATIGDLSVIHMECKSGTVNVNGNDFRGMVNTVQSVRHRHLYIFTHISAVITNQTINDNTFTNLNVNTQANVFLILNGNKMPGSGSKLVNNNSIVTSFTKIASNGTDRVYFIYAGQPSPSGTLVTNTNNNISNVSVNGGTDILGILNYERVSGTSAPKKVINNNICNNWTLVNGDAFGLVARDFGTDSTIITTNTVSNITSSGTIYGIYLEKPPVVHTGIVNVKTNVISNLVSNGAGKSVTGIYNETTANEIILKSNSISNLSSSIVSTPVFGILSLSGTKLTFNKNTISTLTATGNVFGVKVSGAGIGANVLDSNSISGLKSNSSTTSTLLSGIYYSSNNPVSILANDINNLESLSNSTGVFDSSAVVGISFLNTAATNNIIRDNKIYNLKSTNTGSNNVSVAGIATSNTVVGGTTHYNKIYNLTNTNTGTSASIIGFYPNGGNWTVSNNMISLSNGSNTNSMQCFGVNDAGATGTRNYYHNSINIEGSASTGSSNSMGLLYNSIGNSVNILNNIFKITRSGNGNNFAIANTGASFAGFISNYNALNAVNANTVGATSGFTALSLANWRTASSNDGLSHSGLIINFIDAANGDLHLDPNNICSVRGLGLYSPSFAIDWDLQARKTGIAPYGPDLGADEVFKAKVWTGTTNQNWTTATNWGTGTLPTVNDDVEISNVVNSPVIDVASNIQINSVTVKTGGLLTNNGTLNFTDYLNANSNIDCQVGKLNLNSPCKAQALSGSYFKAKAIKDLQISNDVYLVNTVNDTLKVTKNLMFGNVNNKTFTTNSNLTLISTASYTANFADITNAGSNTGNKVSGNVTVERYISARKAWRFLSVPTTSAQTIKQAWQEGAITAGSNPVTSFGIQITSNKSTWAADGFDSYTPAPSVKTFNSITNSWVDVGSTNIAFPSNTKGYMTFVRGDRPATITAVPTVLRTKGNLYTGDQPPITVNASAFISIGNPFASSIDLRAISKTGVREFYYLWDPYLSGNYAVGGYQTLSLVGADYVVTPGGGSYGASGSVQNFIQSGQAFFVQGTVAGGSLTFKENAKSSGSMATSLYENQPGRQLRANLYGVNTDSSTYMADGIFINYDENNTNAVNDMDAIKAGNGNENLSIKTAGNWLSVERRKSIVSKDTIFLDQMRMRAQSYRFEFVTAKLDEPGMVALLEDNYLKTATPINLFGTTIVNFSVTSVAASYATNRFRIVFTQALIVPLTITSVKATQKSTGIQVEWVVENESSIKQYEVERSADARSFVKLNTTTAKNTALSNYNWLDDNYAAGNNYYRIKSIDNDGKIEYSKVVKVFAASASSQEITVYPNPVKDAVINLRMPNNAGGIYGVQLFNMSGQLIMAKQINHASGSSTENIPVNKSLPGGEYKLKVTRPDGKAEKINLIF